MLRAQETLNESTEGIHTKAQAHDDPVDRLALATTSLYRETQDKSLKDDEVAAMALELVRLRHEIHHSSRTSTALKDELIDQTTELMTVQEDNHVLNGMRIISERERSLDDQQ
jgi:hypothetical protein